MKLLNYLFVAFNLVTPVYAENWVEILRNNQIVLSYDVSSIQIHPNHLYVLAKTQRPDDYLSDACLYGSVYACNTDVEEPPIKQVYAFNCQGQSAIKGTKGWIWSDTSKDFDWNLQEAVCQRFGHLLKITS